MPMYNTLFLTKGRRTHLLGSTIAATLLISAFGSADAQDQSTPAQKPPEAPSPAQTTPAPSGTRPNPAQSPPVQAPTSEQTPGETVPALPPVTVVKPTPSPRPTAAKPQPTPGRQEAARPKPAPGQQEAARPKPLAGRQEAARPRPAPSAQPGTPGPAATAAQPYIANFGGSPSEGLTVTSPTHIPTPISQLPNSVSVVTADDIQRDQRQTLPDALNNVPGLNVVQTGGPGGQTSIFMRGTNPNHVKVLVDGVDVSNPAAFNGAFDFSQVLTNDLDRIEVLRGPQSGLYGSDAIGGVISLFTKTGQGPAKLTLQTEAGSFGTFNQMGSLGGSFDAFHYYFSVQHFDSQSTPVTPLYAVQPGATRINDYYNNLSYSTHLNYDFSENFSVSAVARYIETKLRYTGDSDDNFYAFLPTFTAPFALFPTSADAAQSTQNGHNAYARGEAVYAMFDGRIKNYFGYSFTDAWTQFISPQTGDVYPVAFGPSGFTGVRLKEDYRSVIDVAPGQTLVVGADNEEYRLYQYNPLGSDVFFAQNKDRGMYAELVSQFYKNFFLQSNVRSDNNESFGTAVTYRIAPAFIVPGLDTKLKASYGTGFKAPTLEQLYVNFPPFFFANPGLQPEKSVGYDYGFEQPLFNDTFRLGITYYHNDIRNLIQSCSLGVGFTTTLCNIGLATTYGNESFAAWQVNKRLTLRFDYTTTTARDDITQLLLLRRPRNKESYQVIWNPIDPLTLSLNVVHEGTWADINRTGTVPNALQPIGPYGGPYTTTNIAANYIVNDQATVFGRVDNLFNVDYQNPIGFLRPGRGIYGGLRFTNF
jgi:vitamin B12 transporter